MKPTLTHFIILAAMLAGCSPQAEQQAQNSPAHTIADSVKPSSTMRTASPSLQQNSQEDPDRLPASIAGFIPKNYAALNVTRGDLNRDSLEDVILVLKKNGEDSTSDVVDHPEKRPLLVLIAQTGNTYRLAARSDNAVYCVDCGGVMGDPFTGITIKEGYFSVEHEGGSSDRWTRIVTFKYSPKEKKWFLHRDGGDNFSTHDPGKTESHVSTAKDFGVVPFEKFDIYKEN